MGDNVIYLHGKSRGSNAYMRHCRGYTTAPEVSRFLPKPSSAADCGNPN